MKDEHIEKELLKQNKIPGCDQLTRPEEIKALSKYLKNIRTTQENYTSLGKNNLEIPGITTGKLPEIDNLEDHIDTLKVTNSVKLVNGSISLDGDFKEVNNLRNFKDNLLDDRDISLDNHEEYIIDDRKISLEHIKEKLDIIDKNKLSSQKIKLINNKEINKLENTRKNLDIEENIDSLENFSNKINLSDKNDIKELNEHIEKLVNTEQDIVNSLEREKIYINNSNEITSLSNFKDSIEVQENKITELSNKKESLKNIKNQIINNISSYKEEIPNELKESDSLNTSNEKLRTPEELNSIYNEKIKLEGESKSRKVYAGDFILSNSMSFGRPFILKIDGCIHDGWLVIQNYQEYFDLDYLYYLLGSEYVFEQYRKMAAGSSVQNLNKDKVSNVLVRMSLSKTEQTAIAEILSDMDKEIAELESKRTKYERIKQGMMQQLLTGKIRLTD